MTNVCHIILIRFNYNDISKLKKRILLFENVCLPTLINQTNQNFKAVLMVNAEKQFLDLVQKFSNYKNIEGSY